MHNIYDDKHYSDRSIHGYSVSKVIGRLDSLLLILKSCKGDTCINPWKILHRDGTVASLSDALHETYDTYYEAQPKVSFDRCAAGHIIDAEGPQEPLFYRHGLSWEVWT